VKEVRKKANVVCFILAAILASLFIFPLVKVSAEVSIIWDKTYGGTEPERGPSLVTTSDGGYALAGYTGFCPTGKADFWLVKTDASGSKMWSKTYGETNYGGCASSLIVTSDGGYVIAGDSSATGESVNFYLVKTDASGNMIWQKTYGDGIEDRTASVIHTSDGGYALAGFTFSFAGTDVWLGKTDADGNLEWSQTYGGTGDDAASSVVQTSDGGYVLAGDTTSFGAGDYDFWLVKTEAEGGAEPSSSDGEQPTPALALPTEYVYVGVAVVVILVIVIGIVAYKKSK
jgi:hypothetical protein